MIGISKLRNIVVQNIPFKWIFTSRRDDICHSRITILTENRDSKIVIKFTTRDSLLAGNPINEGFPLLKDGIIFSVNLNHPQWTAKFIEYFLDNKVGLTEKRYSEIDGNDLLFHLGYADIEHYLV